MKKLTFVECVASAEKYALRVWKTETVVQWAVTQAGMEAMTQTDMGAVHRTGEVAVQQTVVSCKAEVHCGRRTSDVRRPTMLQ